jgi:hypothetical protein
MALKALGGLRPALNTSGASDMQIENGHNPHLLTRDRPNKSLHVGAEDHDECALVVQGVEDLIGGHSREFILCVLLTVTVNAIHVVEDRAVRRRIEQEYIKALQLLSAVEEQYQPEDATDAPDWADECSAKMMRHVFHAIGTAPNASE